MGIDTKKPVCIVGAGITGATIARSLADRGVSSHVFDMRSHVAGNCHTEWNEIAGCYHHVYGPHIFHTNNNAVIDWVSRFTTLLPYKHSVKSTSSGRVYSLPINLHTLNQFFDASMSPTEASLKLESLREETQNKDANFEARALSLVGRDIYNVFLKGYTKKQWGIDPREIPASILSRLPIRFNYDDNYFFHTVQGLPAHGYTEMVKSMLDHPLISTTLNMPISFEEVKNYQKVFWSAPIEEVFNADEGYLPYRTLEFHTSHIRGDAQGCPVMNYPDPDVKHTRVTQHNYFRSALITNEIKISLITFEYSKSWQRGDIRYYPVHLSNENKLLNHYKKRAAAISNLHLCGRLGQFKYIDMDIAIEEALNLADAVYRHN